MKTLRFVGSINVSDVVVIRNKADNTPVTGIVFGDVTAYYSHLGVAPVEVPLVTQTVTGAHTDGGFVEIDSVNMPGQYRVDHPDAMFVSGNDSVFFQLKGHTAMNPVDVEIELTTFEVSNIASTDRLVNINEITAPSEVSDYIDANSQIAADVTSVLADTNRVDGLIEDDGAGNDRFTAKALEESTGGTGGATAEEVRIEMDSNSTQLAAIVEDTGTILPAQISGIATAVWSFVVENGKSAMAHLIRIKSILGGNSQNLGKEFMNDAGDTVEATVVTDSSKNRTWS